MTDCTAAFFTDNVEVTVNKGTNLLSAAAEAGIELAASCGGRGVCGKCLVRIKSGNVTVEAGFGTSRGEAGMVPACHTVIESDIEVEVPEANRLGNTCVLIESSLDGENLLQAAERYNAAAPGTNPLCFRVDAELQPPTLVDNVGDLVRLKTELRRLLGYDNVGVDLRVMQKLPGVLRKDWKVRVTVFQQPHGEGLQIIDIEPTSQAGASFGLAVDIGTTTVAAHLVDLDTGKIRARAGSLNSQARFGDDVIARMVRAEEDGGLEALQKTIVECINGLVKELVAKAGICRNQVRLVLAAGNTVMTHLFLGVDTRFIRREPYIPAASEFPAVSAREIGLDVNSGARVLCFPVVGSYVGGDIVAGLLVNGQAEAEELTLFIDIGTNGEIVLGNKDWLVTCACSAGPAFEGGGITHGMRAVPGAIQGVSIDLKSDSVVLNTVAGQKPVGICGSGLISCIGELLRAGVIDRTGKFTAPGATPRLREDKGEKEFVLARGEETQNGSEIVITEVDIQNILRAKGAVFAGIQSLLKFVQLDIGTVDRVVIAGGFGSCLDITEAVAIGLLPDLPPQKYEFIGNASVKGAGVGLVSGAAFLRALEYSSGMTYIELSDGSTFMEEFVSAMFFPHTDMELFPSLRS